MAIELLLEHSTPKKDFFERRMFMVDALSYARYIFLWTHSKCT